MANTYCHEGYCNYEGKESDTIHSDAKSGNSVMMGWIYIAAVLVAATVLDSIFL